MSKTTICIRSLPRRRALGKFHLVHGASLQSLWTNVYQWIPWQEATWKKVTDPRMAEVKDLSHLRNCWRVALWHQIGHRSSTTSKHNFVNHIEIKDPDNESHRNVPVFCPCLYPLTDLMTDVSSHGICLSTRFELFFWTGWLGNHLATWKKST